MIYTVVWLPTALNQLANIWMHASDRNAVTQASNEIDRLLRTDPETKVSPCGKLWTLTVAPLAVLCHIDPGDRMVRIIQAKRST